MRNNIEGTFGSSTELDRGSAARFSSMLEWVTGVTKENNEANIDIGANIETE